jgi:hypothetical protein
MSHLIGGIEFDWIKRQSGVGVSIDDAMNKVIDAFCFVRQYSI